MEINVDTCIFEDTGVYTANLIDSTCATSGDVSDGSFFFTAALDGCGTTISESDENSVTFSQTVYTMATTGAIFVGHPYEINFDCTYDTHNNASTSGSVDRVSAETGASNEGNFEFELKLYASEDFSEPIPEGDVVVVGERVYFAVESNLPSTVSFVLNECTISNAQFGMSYNIVNDGCVDQITQTYFHENGPYSAQAALSYAAFRFDTADDLEDDHEEEISCKITVCDNDDATSICQNPPSCGDRRRRSADPIQTELQHTRARFIRSSIRKLEENL